MNRSIICIVFFILITSHCFNGMDNYLYINNVKLKQLQDKMKKQKEVQLKNLIKSMMFLVLIAHKLFRVH